MSDDALISPLDERSARTITLNRPAKANSLSAGLVEELLARVEEAYSSETKLLIFAATGKHFCAGFDFTGYADQSEGDLLRRFVRIEELLQKVRHAPCVTVACVNGSAFGAGADLVAACTYRLGTPGSRLRFPGFQFGVALGTRHLARLIGAQRSREILLGNEVLEGQQALSCGLLTHLLDTCDFVEAIADISKSTARLDAGALKVLLNNTVEDTRDRDLADLVHSVSAPGLRERIARYRSGGS